jgi:hypothetical protein
MQKVLEMKLRDFQKLTNEEIRELGFRRSYAQQFQKLHDTEGNWNLVKRPDPLLVVSMPVSLVKDKHDDIWDTLKNEREGYNAKLKRFRKAVRRWLKKEHNLDPEGVDYECRYDETVLLGFTDLTQATLAKMMLL